MQTVVSMLPIVSTMLMPSRLAEGDVPVWQLVVAIATTVVAAVLLVRAGARVYERDAAAHRQPDQLPRGLPLDPGRRRVGGAPGVVP